jgi:hypothetical protein
MWIKPLTTIHPAYQAYLDDIRHERLDRASAVREAARLTGVAIYDVGNTSFEDLNLTLCKLINTRLSNAPDQDGCMPSSVKHLVVGHAIGTGVNWRFLGGQHVSSYVNANVPHGQAVWVLACETGCERSFSFIEGREMISGARQASTEIAEYKLQL